ncbi:INO80 complex subunit B-like isoform X2 [Corticium candelabrum]|uniref:INO80 complex subunit B-like isoform X2 n=1 Tax=Corticium candelabrum TaxID=121492 RepID=UPI002E267865|nr:INO80 complex subunit B-like isoform X2 [Corticium candelabrum]
MAAGAEIADVSVKDDEDDDVVAIVRKKHKKAKHKKDKKHKKRRERGKLAVISDDDEPTESKLTSRKRSRSASIQEQLTSPGVKLKIKIGGQTTATTVEIKRSKRSKKSAVVGVLSDSGDNTDYNIWGEEAANSIYTQKIGKANQDDDEWLQALEAGELNERGDIMKYSFATTARQRAMMGSDAQEELLELPSGPARGREITEEMQARKDEITRKRRQREAKKREEQKKNTVKKLITKTTGTRKKEDDKKRTRYLDRPTVQYISNKDGYALCFPPGMDFPFKAQTARKPPDKRVCAVEGCSNARRYTCSKTHLPLCSLECYKKVQLNST